MFGATSLIEAVVGVVSTFDFFVNEDDALSEFDSEVIVTILLYYRPGKYKIELSSNLFGGVSPNIHYN